MIAKGTDIFAGTDGDGMFRSIDNGISWNAVDSGLPADAYVYTLTMSGDNIFAGTWGDGVFLYSSNGASWTAVNEGFPAGNIILDLVANDNFLFAATYGSGVWRRPLSEMVRAINPKSHREILNQGSFSWTFAFLRCLASSQHFHVDDSNLIYDFSKPIIIVNILLCNIKTFLSKEYKICLSVYC